jgi:hypothetical protein
MEKLIHPFKELHSRVKSAIKDVNYINRKVRVSVFNSCSSNLIIGDEKVSLFEFSFYLHRLEFNLFLFEHHVVSENVSQEEISEHYHQIDELLSQAENIICRWEDELSILPRKESNAIKVGLFVAFFAAAFYFFV